MEHINTVCVDSPVHMMHHTWRYNVRYIKRYKILTNFIDILSIYMFCNTTLFISCRWSMSEFLYHTLNIHKFTAPFNFQMWKIILHFLIPVTVQY